jgi:hypothetical protein
VGLYYYARNMGVKANWFLSIELLNLGSQNRTSQRASQLVIFKQAYLQEYSAELSTILQDPLFTCHDMSYSSRIPFFFFFFSPHCPLGPSSHDVGAKYVVRVCCAFKHNQIKVMHELLNFCKTMCCQPCPKDGAQS